MSLATELQAIIDKISEDEVLLYTFVNGDINTVVNGAGGPYPSLAKLTSDLSTAYTKQEVDDFLALKATLESPALTGTPTAPTQSPLDNSTKIATTAYVDSSVGPSDKGFFLTQAALVAEYPTGQDGWYAVVGETDTVWTWDSDTTAWKNTDTNSQGTVTSIGITDGNGITSSGGPVTLSGDITVGLDTATQSTLASVAGKAPIADPTFTGTATIPIADITTANITTANITTGNITTADITTANFNAGAIDGGELSWNGQERTLNLVTGVDTTIQVGQELVLYAVNKSGATIPNGSVVSISGSQGNKPAIVLAQADTVANARKAIGVTTESILNNSSGFVTLNGKVRDLVLDDGTYGLGQVVYLSSTVAGGITNIQPDISVELGHVLANTTGGNTNGVIEVQINNESAVHELEQQVPHNSDSVIICNDGDNIQDKYDEAATLTPNGNPLSATNLASLIVMGGTYGNIQTAASDLYVNIIGIGTVTMGSLSLNGASNANFATIDNLTLAYYEDAGNYGIIKNIICDSFSNFLINDGLIENVKCDNNFYMENNSGIIDGIKTTSGFEVNENSISGIIKDVYATGNIDINDNFGTVDNVNSTSIFSNSLNSSIIKNCSASSFLTGYMLNDGTIDNCHSTGTTSYAFGGSWNSENYGTIKNCTAAGQFSFGQQYENSVTENCVGGDKAFAASSSQIQFDVNGFGVKGTYRNCTAGVKSFFGANETSGIKTVQANFYNCTAGANSFGFVNFGGAETHFSGKAIGCTSGNNGFFRAITGSTKILDGAVIENCVGGFNSFANGVNASNEGVILRCRVGTSGANAFSVTGTGKVRLCLDEDYNEINLP